MNVDRALAVFAAELLFTLEEPSPSQAAQEERLGRAAALALILAEVTGHQASAAKATRAAERAAQPSKPPRAPAPRRKRSRLPRRR